MIVTIPDGLRRQTLAIDATGGQAWLDELPALVADLAERWSLAVGEPFSNLTWNWVAPALRADGAPAILKLGRPGRALATEVAALAHYAGDGCVRLHAADPERGALLLERAEPGETLWNMADDERATTIAAAVMSRLWKPAPPAAEPFPTVADWARGLGRLRAAFDGGTGPFPRLLVEQAEALFANLLPSQTTPVLLHGDLHHDNILAATREPWLAIDPKGVIGEPASEAGAFIRNPWPAVATRSDLPRLLARRIDQFAEQLNLDRPRVHAWALSQAVLSAWWTWEDEGRLDHASLAIARAISR